MFVQLVRFRLRQTGSEVDFLQLTARAGRDFLAKQPGFLGRDVLQAEDGGWHGLIRWRDAESSQAAGHAWGKHPLAQAISRLTDPDSLSITDLILRHRDEPAEP